MKAIVFTRYGSPDYLELREVPKPVPADDEVLVRVHASSVNSWDWEFLQGTPFVNRLMYGLMKPKAGKRSLGSDIAGIVEAAGSSVTSFQPGDAVFGDLWDNWGGFAEFACAPESALQPKPPNISFEQAAAVPQAGVLALQGLRKSGQLEPGQKVLINGGGGGVGTFAIQLARLAGAEVTGVDNRHKQAVMRSLGADHVIDYEQMDFYRSGELYDLIVDCQCFRSMFDNLRALKPHGNFAMVGGSIPRVYQLWLFGLVLPLTGETRKLELVAEGPNKGLAELGALLARGDLRPVIDSCYELSAVAEALHYFGKGRHRGKIIIRVKH
ncbi:MAG: NAD(P)-dependent alcohol dehydrogenase [Gammaproteobacteria bacterium]|nr:NAD(P)-dependent alcohol dehydrogenase [Gammaproteobacteria bacterium]